MLNVWNGQIGLDIEETNSNFTVMILALDWVIAGPILMLIARASLVLSVDPI